MWNCYRDQPSNPLFTNSESFKYKTSITGIITINPPRGLEFQITDTKLYLPVFTLSKENDIKLSGELKSGFKNY